jgi:hypothetical protein
VLGWDAGQPLPWLIPDDVAVLVLQVIWDSIYNDKVPWTVTVGDCVFECVHRFYLSCIMISEEGQVISSPPLIVDYVPRTSRVG